MGNRVGEHIVLVNAITDPSKKQKLTELVLLTYRDAGQWRLGNIGAPVNDDEAVSLSYLKQYVEEAIPDTATSEFVTDWKFERPIGVIDDINNVFTLNATPASIGRLFVILNGRLRVWGKDYYLIGRDIHFGFNIALNSIIECVYQPTYYNPDYEDVKFYTIETLSAGRTVEYDLPFDYSLAKQTFIIINGSVRRYGTDYTITEENKLVLEFSISTGAIIWAIVMPFTDPSSNYEPVFCTPIGIVNGVNVDFVLPYTPINDSHVVIINDSSVRLQDNDYRVRGDKLQMKYAPVGRISAFLIKQKSSTLPSYVLNKVRRIFVDTTISLDDEVIRADATSGNITVTLPKSNSAPGKEYTVTKVDSSTNQVIIDSVLGSNMSGTTLPFSLLLQGEALSFKDSEFGWNVT